MNGNKTIIRSMVLTVGILFATGVSSAPAVSVDCVSAVVRTGQVAAPSAALAAARISYPQKIFQAGAGTEDRHPRPILKPPSMAVCLDIFKSLPWITLSCGPRLIAAPRLRSA